MMTMITHDVDVATTDDDADTPSPSPVMENLHRIMSTT